MLSAELGPALAEAWKAMSLTELLAVAFALLYVALAAAEKIACWPAGIVSSLLFLVLTWSAGLMLESILQVYYAGMGVYGWVSWAGWGRTAAIGDESPRLDSGTALPIRRMRRAELFAVLGGGAIVTVLAGMLFENLGSSMPYLDATTTVFAVITTWMVTRKILENWLFWIAIDALSIGLYGSKALYLSALLYAAYVVIAVFGYLKWKRDYAAQKA